MVWGWNAMFCEPVISCDQVNKMKIWLPMNFTTPSETPKGFICFTFPIVFDDWSCHSDDSDLFGIGNDCYTADCWWNHAQLKWEEKVRHTD